MIRKFINSVIETTIQAQPEATAYPNPFTKKETSHLGWLTSVAPCFPVQAKNINILLEPQQFYNTLVEKCKEAKNRITLVSLYLGNGDLESKLVQAIKENQYFQDGSLKINVLLDYTRGSRFSNNSRTMLKPLLDKNEINCRVSLYHTPVLRGITKKLAPNRWNELFGVQHMKLYIFDDTLVISGANLSNDYFTNRQDRYFMIKDKQLCDFYCGLVNRVQKFSLQMDKNDNVTLSDGWKQLPYEGSKDKFIQKAGDIVESYLLESRDENNYCKKEGFDTWIFPMVQMGQLGIFQDAQITEKLFAEAPQGTKLNIATGYFNLTDQYMKTILYDTPAECNLLMAHPKANGFMGAKGAAGGIPDAYSLIAQRFKKKLETLGQHSRVSMQEYLREGWTYHAKGLWYYPPNTTLPYLTLIGSPNFGERSVKRDLETQLAIVTEDPEFQKRLSNECDRLYAMGLPAKTDRVIPKWVHTMVFLFRGYF